MHHSHMALSTCKQPKESRNLYWSISCVYHIALYFSTTNHKSIFEALSLVHFTPKFIETQRSFDLQTHVTLWNISFKQLTLNSTWIPGICLPLLWDSLHSWTNISYAYISIPRCQLMSSALNTLYFFDLQGKRHLCTEEITQY